MFSKFWGKTISSANSRADVLCEQRILLLYDSTDIYAVSAYENAVKALDYARLEFVSLDFSREPAWPDLTGFSSLLLCSEFLHKLDSAEVTRIRGFVARGGGLAVIYRGWNVGLADLFGVSSVKDWPGFASEEVGGLQLPTDIFSGFQGTHLAPDELSGHTPYDFEPVAAAKVLATSSCGKPLAWLVFFEKGRVIYWNSAVLAEKIARGLIVQSLMSIQQVSVLPIANVATIQIDDFPPEFEPDCGELIVSDYVELDPVTFYERIWLPDMMALADSFGLAYTCLPIFDYAGLGEPPFDFDDWYATKIQIDGKSVSYKTNAAWTVARTGELGLHGYNHVALTLKQWPDKSAMVRALSAVIGHWKKNDLGPLPRTYVPPNNEYDETGANAISEALPGMEVICGVYLSGDFESGGNREFGPEPWNSRLFSMPRATSGYERTAIQRFAMVSQIANMGVWTHFIHADDVYDTPGNNATMSYHRNAASKPWRGDAPGQANGIYYAFQAWLQFTRSEFPWLNFVETRAALPIVKSHLDNEVGVRFARNSLSLSMKNLTCFQIRLNNGLHLNPAGLSNAELVHCQNCNGDELYTLRATGHDVKLEIL